MGPADETRAAVRIELTDGVGADAPPGNDSGRAPGRSAAAVFVVLVGFGLVAILVAVTRPGDGETAAGTPITAPATSVGPGESNRTTSAEGDSSEEGGVISPVTTPSGNEQLDPPETSRIDMLVFNIVEADFGWIALGFGLDDNTGALWRSTDGLEWTELPTTSLPDGDVLGFERFDGTYLLAVDELETWSDPAAFNFEERGFPEHRISVWTSPDAVTWAPSDLPVLEGVGFPYPTSFSPTTYAVPVVDNPPGPNDVLIDFLAPFVDASDAAKVCSSRNEVEADSFRVILEDCDGEPVAVVDREEHLGTFDRLEQSFCLQLVLSAGRQRFSTMFVERGADPIRAEFGFDVNLFGRATPDGVLSFPSSSGGGPLPAECDDASFGTDGAGLFHWTVEEGPREVSPAEPPDPREVRYPFSVMSRSADGRFFVASSGSVWSSGPPFEQWDEVVAPLEAAEGGAGTDVRTTISFDGRFALASSSTGLFVAATDDGRWTKLPDVSTNRLGHRILLATDDYVIVEALSGDRLVKIPIAR